VASSQRSRKATRWETIRFTYLPSKGHRFLFFIGLWSRSVIFYPGLAFLIFMPGTTWMYISSLSVLGQGLNVWSLSRDRSVYPVLSTFLWPVIPFSLHGSAAMSTMSSCWYNITPGCGGLVLLMGYLSSGLRSCKFDGVVNCCFWLLDLPGGSVVPLLWAIPFLWGFFFLGGLLITWRLFIFVMRHKWYNEVGGDGVGWGGWESWMNRRLNEYCK